MTENQKENLFVVTALQGGLLDGGPFFGPKIRLIRQPKGPNWPTVPPPQSGQPDRFFPVFFLTPSLRDLFNKLPKSLRKSNRK